MGEHIEIVGIDHGYRNMKTSGFCFPTAISQLALRPDDIKELLIWNDECYSLNGKQLSSVDCHIKTESQEFYLLTLVCLAKELRARGCPSCKVRIAAGLPQKWYLPQKEIFKQYILQNGDVTFSFEGLTHKIEIVGAGIYTQGYAAALLKLANYKGKYCIVIDIGGETIDIIPTFNGKPVDADCRIDTRACIWLVNHIKEEIGSVIMEPVHESFIVNYMQTADRHTVPANKYEQVIHDCLVEYCGTVFTMLKEFHFNIEVTPLIFVGGGADVIYRFGEYEPRMTEFVLDVSANAKGYERIDRALAGRR